MLIAALILWAIAGLSLTAGMWPAMRAWAELADGMHRADPRLRRAIGWPDRNLGIVQLTWPGEGFRIWRVRVRTLLHGLPRSVPVPEALHALARRYRRQLGLALLAFAVAALACAVLDPALLILLGGFALSLFVLAGRRPDPATTATSADP